MLDGLKGKLVAWATGIKVTDDMIPDVSFWCSPKCSPSFKCTVILYIYLCDDSGMFYIVLWFICLCHSQLRICPVWGIYSKYLMNTLLNFEILRITEHSYNLWTYESMLFHIQTHVIKLLKICFGDRQAQAKSCIWHVKIVQSKKVTSLLLASVFYFSR